MDIKPQKGFAIISLLLTTLIIGILIALYFGGDPGKSKTPPAQVREKALQDAQRNSQDQLGRQIEIQNQLNSIQ